ncbi:hypothetical protein [Patiriisocius hiemis]|uniref:Uncharacterized protein n=1 Tax=Patiriisocius hiemis TaxID=3075604 RepID=A0ABU2YDF4_9FLAO|nr:hypothetical protein [Constantimarinum sp. W242]MDT0556208.1 hypothetical protein [Constantimarinum sp. W242]
MSNQKIDLDKMMVDEWRNLGFYYDRDDRIDVNQWRFYGSKKGFQNFVSLLEKYTNNPQNEIISEHGHFGPYSYLKIMTWDKPVITEDYIAGTIQDLKNLQQIIADKLSTSRPGQTFNIDKDYGQDNTITAKFFVMSDDFDPYTMDELIVSGRQNIVNENMNQKK